MKDIVTHQQTFIEKLKESGKSFNTVKNYRTDLKCFSDFLVNTKNSMDLNEFTDTQVREYAHYIDNKYDSPNSKRRRIQALRMFFDYLVANGHFPNNPIKKMVSAPKVVDAPNPLPYHKVQELYQKIDELYRASEGTPGLLHLRNKVLIQLIYGAGLKVSDIKELKRDHVSLGIDGQYRVMVAHPKRDPYTITLPKSFSALYKTYLIRLEEQQNQNQIDFDDILFNANPFRILSGGLSPRGCELIFEEFSKIIDYKVTPRSLRQSCIFKWLGMNKTESTVKEWMGVRPVYSLAPYKILLKEEPEKHHFRELDEQE